MIPLLLFLYFVILVAIHGLSDGFNYRQNYKKTGHNLSILHIGLWLFFPWILYQFFHVTIPDSFESVLPWVVMCIGYTFIRIGIFDLFWNLANGQSIYFVGTTSWDDILEGKIYDDYPKWVFWVTKSVWIIFSYFILYLLFTL